MDYEKKYNEALERARALWREAIEKEYVEDYLKDYETIFPELAESEDEKVIKALETFINQPEIAEKITFEARIMWLSWLEKQKEDKEELVYRLNGLMQDYIKEGKDDEEKEHRLKCYQLFWDALEDVGFFEQKEQKPNIELIQRSWYMEGYHDRDFGKEPKWIIKTGEGGPKYELNPKYGQPLADEQKPAWSEDIIRKAIKEVGLTQHQIDWFKTNVFPPKQEWSEEDEKMLTGIIERGSVQVPPYTTALREEQIEWLMNRLKSLRPDTFQNGNSRPKTSDNWKPAQEQEEPEYYQHFDPDC